MLHEPLAMASVVHSLNFQSSRSTYLQYGTTIPCLSSSHQKASFKLRDVSSFPYCCSSFVFTTNAQIASSSATIATQKLDSPPESDTTPVPSPANSLTLSKRSSHLADLVFQLSEGADVASTMEPWLEKLSFHCWNQLVIELGNKDWSIPLQIVSLFREKGPLLDQTVLFRKNKEEEKDIDSRAESSQVTAETHKEAIVEGLEQNLQQTLAHSVVESSQDNIETCQEMHALEGHQETVTFATTNNLQAKDGVHERVERSLKRTSPTLRLHTTLIRVLAKWKRFEEIENLRLQMTESGIELDSFFYNALLDVYTDERLSAKAFKIFQDMKLAGLELQLATCEKLVHIHLNQEDPDLDAAKEITKDLIGKGFPVSIAIFNNLVKAYWEAKDVDGAEEAFEAMQLAGHIPDMKVFWKVMQLRGRKGDHERVVELLELMIKLGIQPNRKVYDYLLHSYCKAGLMDKAKETFLKYESVLRIKPTIIAYNMLVDGYGKQGLHEEAFETFKSIRKSGLKPTFVTYSSIISAMAQVGKFEMAEQLYKKMLMERTQPNLHTYTTMIRCYSKCYQTREGHKVYTAMRKAPLTMTEAAYGVALSLYIEGAWYDHAAALLKEIEEKGIVLDATGHSALIRSFNILEKNTTPLAKAVQESELDVCKLMASLFLSVSEGQKLGPELIESVTSFLENWEEADNLDAKSLVHHAFMDYFWRKGYKGTAKKILDLGREVYAGNSPSHRIENEWVLDVRGLGVGGAKVAFSEWLLGANEGLKMEGESVANMVLVTGDEMTLNVPQDNRAVKRAISSMLTELGSPFAELPTERKKMVASLGDVLQWVSDENVKKAISLIDHCQL